MLRLFSIFFLFNSALGDIFICNNEDHVLNADNPTFSMDSKIMGPKQRCVYNFTIPSDFLAEIQFEASNMRYLDIVQAYSHWGDNNYQTISIQGNEDNSLTSETLKVKWPPTFFQVIITTDVNSTMILTVKVAIRKFFVNSEAPVVTTSPNQQPLYVQLRNFPENMTIFVQSTLNGVSASIANPSSTSFTPWVNIFVYEKDGDKLNFRGTLYSCLYQYRPLFPSKGNNFLLYRAQDDEITGTIVINDIENVKALTYFQITWSPYDQADTNRSQGFLLDASQGLAALTILNEADGTNAIFFDGLKFFENTTGPVKLLNGGMLKDYDTQGTLLGSYSDNNQGCPQFLPGMARTFVLEKGEAVVYYTARGDFARNSDATPERTGFIMSDNYPFMGMNQDASFNLKTVTPNEPFAIEITINGKNPNSDAALNITTKQSDDQGNVYTNSTTIMLSSPTPSTFNQSCLELDLVLFGGINASTGSFLPFRILGSSQITTGSISTSNGWATTSMGLQTTSGPSWTSSTASTVTMMDPTGSSTISTVSSTISTVSSTISTVSSTISTVSSTQKMPGTVSTVAPVETTSFLPSTTSNPPSPGSMSTENNWGTSSGTESAPKTDSTSSSSTASILSTTMIGTTSEGSTAMTTTSPLGLPGSSHQTVLAVLLVGSLIRSLL